MTYPKHRCPRAKVLISSLTKVVRRPGFWLIPILLVLITLPHYEEALPHPAFLTQLTASIGLDRHAFERILYLAPIVWAGFLFSWRGAFVTSLAALACMLPRVVFISPYPKDALFEITAVFILSNIVAITFVSLRKERERRTQLEVAQQELQLMQENLHFYLQQTSRAQEEERKRISRELHDETIQALVVLSRQLDALASSSKELPEDKNLLLEDLRQQTNNVIQGVRRLNQDLRPDALDRLGLLPALEWMASDVAEYSGIAIKVNTLGTERRFPEEIELMLFRITQEALRNVWRHSEATRAEVIVEFDDRKTKITVSDNGKGFNLPKTIGDLARDGKLGLAGMQERARLLGGTLTVQSELGRGSSITVELLA